MTVLKDSRGRTLPQIESPGPDKLRVYGDLTFLAFRSPRHAPMPVAGLRRYFEPAVELGQFRVFRFDDVPRAMFTWAWLDTKSARKLVKGDPLDAHDWQSGDQLWIVDLIAPYPGLTSQIVRWLMKPGHFAERDFWFRRVSGPNDTKRVVHIDFEADRLSRVYSGPEYLRKTG